MNTSGQRLAAAADVARAPMLAQATGDRLRELAAAHPVRHFRAGSALLRQGGVTVNRALQQLARTGIISVRPLAIIVHEAAKLGRATTGAPPDSTEQDENGRR